MPEKAKVHVSYGPYMNCLGQLIYEPARLNGLRTILEGSEHEIFYHKSENLNELSVHVNGEQVYEGSVKKLDFSEFSSFFQSNAFFGFLLLVFHNSFFCCYG